MRPLIESFRSQDSKKLLFLVIAILLGCLLTGQVVIKLMTNDFKEKLITHDYSIAGYLSKSDLGQSQITKAFTAEKSAVDLDAGQTLLQSAGYEKSISNHLLPIVANFQEKYSLIVLVISLIFTLAILGALLVFNMGQEKKYLTASRDISKFLAGDHNIRLNDHGEGNLAKLFSAINTIVTSLTAHIQKEKQNKEFLKDTISDISHQLKTPLAALNMYNEIIFDENGDNQVVSRFALKSKDELVRIEYLIQNLLKLARLDAGAIKLEKNNQRLKTFLENVIKRFQIRAEMESKMLTLNCQEALSLNYDQSWFLEAVSNIIKNALDHTKAGDEIKIICDQTPLMIRISIQDNGLGIHPDDLHYIFKRFYRSQFSKETQGTGIGLTLAKSIIEKHGGSITVESQLRKGTIFRLAFPKLTNL